MIFKDHVQWPSDKLITDDAAKKKGITSEADEYKTLLAELNKKIGNRWPVVVKWHPSRVKTVADSDAPGGYRTERPPEFPVTLQWTALGLDNKKHVWTYCDNYEPDATDKKKNSYFPTAKILSGRDTFTKDDEEFLVWLYLCFPGLEGGKNESRAQNFITFDLPHIDMLKENEYDTVYGKVLTLINDKDLGKSVADLRQLLTSYFVPGVDKMEDYEVRVLMKEKATQGATQEQKLESMKLFLSRENNPEGLKVRWLCQKALEKGLIEYNAKRRSFNFIMDGKPIEPAICVIPPDATKDKNQYLHESMSGLPQNAEYLKMIENSIGLTEAKESKKSKKDISIDE